jgi:hypothetical protein
MAPYRVGVALLRQAERQLAWIDENRADLQPVRVLGAPDGLVRLVLTFDAMSEADAIEQITDLFEKAARETGDDVSPSRAGPIGMHAWKVGDDPPPEYEPG